MDSRRRRRRDSANYGSHLNRRLIFLGLYVYVEE